MRSIFIGKTNHPPRTPPARYHKISRLRMIRHSRQISSNIFPRRMSLPEKSLCIPRQNEMSFGIYRLNFTLRVFIKNQRNSPLDHLFGPQPLIPSIIIKVINMSDRSHCGYDDSILLRYFRKIGLNCFRYLSFSQPRPMILLRVATLNLRLSLPRKSFQTYEDFIPHFTKRCTVLLLKTDTLLLTMIGIDPDRIIPSVRTRRRTVKSPDSTINSEQSPMRESRGRAAPVSLFIVTKEIQMNDRKSARQIDRGSGNDKFPQHNTDPDAGRNEF